MNDPRIKRYRLSFALLALLLMLLLALNAGVGSTALGGAELWRALLHREEGGMAARILWSIRLPRLLSAALLGGALAVAGYLLQTFFSNPIAGPFVLGISSGAKLLVALTMIGCLSRGLVMRAWVMVAAAFLGSLLCMGAILLAARKMRGMAMLIVCGVMIGYVCSAITEIAVSFAEDSNIVNLHNWSMGSFAGIGWNDVGFAALLVLLCLGWAMLLSKPMGAYQLGEGYARNMGVNVRSFRLQLILLSSLLAAAVTAFAGPISFVGVAVPHLIKSLFGTAQPRRMIPACFLGGAVFCLGCDLLARMAFAPMELSISSVTAVFGAPVVIAMLLRRQKR